MYQYEICCLVCDKRCTERGQIHANGWRLAPNRIGGYTCGKQCDDVIIAYDKSLKTSKDKSVKEKKVMTSKPTGGFQPLIYRGIHPIQEYNAAGAITHSAGPADDSMRMCLDLKGVDFPFKVGDQLGTINARTGQVEFNDKFKQYMAGVTTLTDDLITPNIEHSSFIDGMVKAQKKDPSPPRPPFHRYGPKKRRR